MASAAEAEIGASFINAQGVVPECTPLIKILHPQPPTRKQVENATANLFANKTLTQKRSKAINMRFYWIQDRCAQQKYKCFWRSGATNLGDYHIKHHYSDHHRLICHKYLHTDKLIN